MTYEVKVPRTTPNAAYYGLKALAKQVRNLKSSGHAMHNAVVDKDFTLQPLTDDALQQIPDDLTPVTTEAQAIVRANLLKVHILRHLNDATYAHKAADGTSAALITAPDATNSGTLSTLLEQLRAAMNAHQGYVASHNRFIVMPQITTAAVDAGTNVTVTNLLQLHIEHHFYSAAETLILDPC